MSAPIAAEPEIHIRGVRKVFGTNGAGVVALDGIDLDVARGELVCLLGPSGCGKTTLLNAVAGFSLPTDGEIVAAGRLVTEPGPDRGMVFQEYALFPWMTVWANVAFGLEMRREPRERIRETVDALLRKLHLTEFGGRFPKDLSGGMRQRVAIARILALDSPILLMDEPFGALDALTRRNLQDELLRIWTELKKTILFVTHGIEESIYLADRIVVMTYRPGRVKTIVPVPLDRPRDVSSPQFNDLKRELSRMVMEEQERFEQDEARRDGGRDLN
ncbi:MAG TPA: ABC transporter ATP-binding protein [Thermoanaerobaculia bacterium]|nr:ABC transporter ATP-binding protein [Thermoanaerobaculia bacterium]